jgi:hypothetical protein
MNLWLQISMFFLCLESAFVFEAEMVILKGSGMDGWRVVVGANDRFRNL